jgi:hypothetical protein
MDVSLECCICRFIVDDPEDAVTIINGQAVCDDHASYVQGASFSTALAWARRDLKKDGEPAL